MNLAIWHSFPDIIHIIVNNGFKSATFCFILNGLAIWFGLPDIRHIKVNYDRQSAILIELKFFRSYPSLKPHNLFYINGLDIWHFYQILGISKLIMAYSRPFGI